MTTNMQRASIVARHVNLVSVTLKEANVSSSFDPLNIPAELDLTLRFRGDYGFDENDKDHVYVTLDCRFGASADEHAKTNVCDVQAVFLLIYKLEDAATFPSDALEHFAHLNGAYNAWPYWRQFVQSTTAEMGLSGVTLPVFRPPIVKLEDEETAEKTAEREMVNS